jgi:hypothetical protein
VLVILVQTPQQTVHPNACFPVALPLATVCRCDSLRRRPLVAATRLRRI